MNLPFFPAAAYLYVFLKIAPQIIAQFTFGAESE